ncbi:MAG: amino acid adenylation domain-containing protein [Nostoc sp. ChiSLP02]|nr:amino acid adenylation domain-containing protein [Nostoc sp. DedSLP05]MDZ8097834.1 amino acid adenylation domain-containing protein [Nostoc sp. DedSLP01]MDZ8183919.1 amino acid adenylation domain-containing protein [Nostoc sp. ChiSLP02]
MSDLLKRLENLSPEKRELVLQKLKKQQKSPPLTPVSREQPLPLSFAQQRLWFIDQLEGENCVYNVPFFWQISGVLNVSALEKAIATIIQRHEVLRTSFSIVDESPIQVIHAHPQLKLQVLDWRQVPTEHQLSKTRQFAISELQQPFDLSNPPLLRVKLLQLAEKSHLLLMVIHHIVCDGWSMDIFRRELFAVYTAFCAGESSPLPELSLQYADFAHWQRQWLQGEVLQTQLNYWQKQLADVPPLLELPTDKPRPSVQSFRGRSEFLELNRDLTQQLKRLSQESGTTLFMTMLAVFTLLLSRYSGQEDIVVGSAIANRNRREIEPLIGFFVNTLALRTKLQGNPTFLELLERVKQVTLDAYDHQDLPFEKLVDELGLERSLSHHPLFQVAFGLQSGTPEKLEIPGLTLSRFEWENTTTLFDLSLIFRETPQGLTGEWEYATDLFEAETIQRMAGHFEVLLKQIIDNPKQPINSLSLLTEYERHKLQSWNQTQTQYPHDKTLVDLFEEQVRKNPDNQAVFFESKTLTYQELNQKANQLAYYLIHNYQIQPDTLIGLSVERSLEMIIGVLGILKAGGAYVPIDPNYPQERIKFMLEDSGISVLLTQSFLLDRLPLPELEKSPQLICLDAENLAEESIENPLPQSTPNDLAYVIYTSGSTGRPKGVMIEHRGLVNLTVAVDEALQIQPQSRLLQFASFSFDASIWEITTTLGAGACLYLAKKETLLPSQGLVDFLIEHKISHATLPPSVLSLLPQANLPALQILVTAGEACLIELVSQWAKGRHFFNAYGPTESTVCASIAVCQPNGKKPPIGKPISNFRIYILDAHNQILPPGIPGELCIAGVGLARGYLNRPELTAEKFIEIDLFGKVERIYKTGDLAKWNTEGNLEYLGRIDEQVKLRGFRVELGEIESLLLQHSSVKEAVVILYETDSNPRLVVYITTAEKFLNLEVEVKEYLKNLLPNYMIPSQIMVLEQLPLTANGKLDRRALPTPNTSASTELEIPVTPTEEILASLWQDLLKIQSVGRSDNFFEMGGHSLLATQLVARIRDSFGVELPVRKVFEQSVLSELAREIDKASASVALPSIVPQPENEPKTLSFAQSRLWFLAQLEAEGNSASYNMPFALQLDGNLNVEALRQSLTYLLQRHNSLRTYFPALEGEPQVVVKDIADIEVLEIADLQALNALTQAKTVQQLADTHAQEPFDLNTGPLFRAKLLQLSEHKNVLLINMHHIISDGWSMGVFKREWEQAYTAYAAGSTPNLSPLPIQYSDYAAWQRSWLQGEILSSQEDYWQQQLSDAPRVLELATDYPRPAQQSYQGEREEYYLSKELTEQLKIVSQKHGVSLFMTLLAAFSILLSRYSRQNDLCIGSAIANRTHSYTERLIGFFVNTLVLRSKIKPEQAFIDLLQQIRQTCLDAYAHQDIPFEYLVEKLQPERSLSRNPLCQVMIALQNTEGMGKNVSLPGLEIQSFDQSFPFAKFDLGLDLREHNNQLNCVWEYATDLFAADTIKRMARHFEVLLTAITQNPQQPISQLPLLTTAEIQQLQVWNQTDTDYPHNQTLVTLFEQQAAKTPDNIAIVFESQSLTYHQLNQTANQLAHYLIQNYQIQPDTLIGISVERSLEMIIGVLGILKAGGAYVPIDPNYPQERIKFMLEDSGISVLLTQSFLLDQLTVTELKHHFICLDEEVFVEELTHNPTPQSTPDNLAYVIYTSGSTGRPKGVMIEHKAIVNLALGWVETFQVQSHSRVLQFGSFSFDLSIGEIATALSAGACLYLGNKDTVLPGKSLVDFLTQHKITHSFLSPSALSVLPKASFPDLQCITVGGEACTAELVSQWGNEQSLYNCYGPTESTVTAAISHCQPNGKKPAIGKPISNVHIYILDAHNQALPPGIPGELCVAGVGLARGYLSRPELTSEKFLEVELFGKTERIYKTGDLARWLPDGNLEYLGRIDNQVKLRGFRIELSEIEASLVKHSKIQEAVVIVREETDLDKRLIAYIVPTATEEGTNSDELIELWENLFNDNYSQQQNPNDDPTLNIVGWNDSYTAQPIPQAAMQEWRDKTVEQILELAPKRVWEIGCGSGMLLFKIAPYCQHYLGTDFSPDALQYITQHLEQQSLQEKVTLKTSAAHQFDGIETNAYDLVIINSVIQYFPSLDYLLSVIEGAIKTVNHQGKIFIGDVRNLHLLEAFHTAAEFYRAPDELSIQDLRQQIQNSIRTEEELLIDPDFFIALKQKFPRISHLQIELKRGYSHTEMSRFRYDVVLYLDRANITRTQPKWLDWHNQNLNLETIERILATEQPDLLGIKNIPNARLTSEMALLEKIPQLEGNLADLKAAILQIQSGIEPESLRTLARDLPYKTFTQYSSTGFSDYDVVFQKNIPEEVTIPRFATKSNWLLKPWQKYANQPLQYRTNQADPALLEEWRDFLSKTLPDYMIPSHFIVLEKLPLTPNGKLDRKALPALHLRIERSNVAPRNEVEQKLAQLWSTVLKSQEFGIYDNFFDLGGHSLLAVKLLNLMQQVFEQKFALSSLFQNPTIAQLAEQICNTGVQQSHPDLLLLQPQGNATPLFFLPGANGHGFYFRDLAINLGNEHPLYSLETPGRDGSTPIPESVKTHARQLIELLRQQQPQGPYILVGYSSGSGVAFEIASQLEQQGETLSLLAMLDSGLVSRPEYLTDTTELDWIWQMIRRQEILNKVSLGLQYEDLTAQPNDQARWDLAAEYLYKFNVLPENSTLALLKTSLKVMRSLTFNYANYQPNYRISAPIVLFRAQEVHEIVLQEIRATSNYDLPDWGWQTYTQQPVKVISVPGNHGRMLYEPNVKVLAIQLQTAILEAEKAIAFNR